MKATFESEDPKEILRLAKSLDMASALFTIAYNLKHDTPEEFEMCVREIIEELNIDEMLD